MRTVSRYLHPRRFRTKHNRTSRSSHRAGTASSGYENARHETIFPRAESFHEAGNLAKISRIVEYARVLESERPLHRALPFTFRPFRVSGPKIPGIERNGRIFDRYSCLDVYWTRHASSYHPSSGSRESEPRYSSGVDCVANKG